MQQDLEWDSQEVCAAYGGLIQLQPEQLVTSARGSPQQPPKLHLPTLNLCLEEIPPQFLYLKVLIWS